MKLVCLDLEGVLVPEIWIAFSEQTGIKELRRTTREEPDYEKLMYYRIDILRKHNLGLKDIQDVIADIKPLEGAKEFLDKLRELTQVVILSDTFSEFAKPLMKQLGWPTILSNSLDIDSAGMIQGIRMRQTNGKLKAIEGFKSMGIRTFAAGDSYNDLAMIHTSDAGCLFRAPERILAEEPNLKLCTEYDEFYKEIEKFVNSREE